MSALLMIVLTIGAAPPQPSALDAMKPEEILSLLNKPRAHGECERALLILWRQKREGDPPAAPKFPFTPLQARAYQLDYARWAGLPRTVTNGDGITLMLIPPGTFRMGSPAQEKGRAKDEEPVTVTLTMPFYLAKHELTIAQFRRFVERTGHVTDGERNNGGHAHDEKAVWINRPGTSWKKPGYAGKFTLLDNHPVVHVSHDDATAFCRWATSRGDSRLRYTLPTEAQWEWACRAGSDQRFWWGDGLDHVSRRANVGDKSLKRIHPQWPRTTVEGDDEHPYVAPVGTYAANAWFLHDVIGNVWEFCSTKSGPYPKGPVKDPGDLDQKRGFAVRGGGWSNEIHDCRCATRNADPPRFCHSNLGFRVALVLP